MTRMVGIGAAAKALGVSISTLRRWEDEGRIMSERTPGGQRRYDLDLISAGQVDRGTIGYAIDDPDRSLEVAASGILREMIQARGWDAEILCEEGRPRDIRRPGLLSLIRRIDRGEVGRLVLLRSEQVLEQDFDLFLKICGRRAVEVAIFNPESVPQSPFLQINTPSLRRDPADEDAIGLMQRLLLEPEVA